ncbi:MAG: methyltransferase domain-containing protein [Candidatus Omnitrophota bacterium]|nr:methyltransferase domain-containing protein [Candidatus Omnitrophota bacterium]MDZ4242712.1 methyltransferase domain-containing protein [Candidatus Omnitrophota bacterium]
MILNLLDRKIRRAFSGAAMQYEVLAGLQKEIGRELIRKIVDRQECSSILDVGMGTGWMTDRLRFWFPDAAVTGLDVADGMVRQARDKYGDLAIVQADAQALPFCENSFDVVVSNLSYQWANDLTQAFAGAWSCLKPGGTLFATLFGRQTFCELFEALEAAAGDGARPSPVIRRLAGRAEIEAALRAAGFQDIELKDEIIKTHFDNMMALLKWIKDIGANVRERDIFVGRDLLYRAAHYYQDRFKDRWGVFATFEVVWITARK